MASLSSSNFSVIKQIIAASSDTSIKNLRFETARLINKKSSEKEKFEFIQEILSASTTVLEQSGAIIFEAWTLLTGSEKIWRAQFKSLKDAVASLDTTQLKHIRQLFSQGPNRRQSKTQIIQAEWGIELTTELATHDRGKHNVAQIAIVASSFDINVAQELLRKIAFNWIKNSNGGRADTKKIISIDCSILAQASSQKVEIIRRWPDIEEDDTTYFNLRSQLAVFSDVLLLPQSVGSLSQILEDDSDAVTVFEEDEDHPSKKQKTSKEWVFISLMQFDLLINIIIVLLQGQHVDVTADFTIKWF